MAGIEKININNSASMQNMKNILGFAVKNRRGYYEHLEKIDQRLGETLEEFTTTGLIKTGHTLKSETYSITNLGDEYYKELFGIWDYLGKRISGFFERFVKQHM